MRVLNRRMPFNGADPGGGLIPSSCDSASSAIAFWWIYDAHYLHHFMVA